jgi:hypothetical protein
MLEAASQQTQSLETSRIIVPTVLGAEILEDGPVDVEVGVETAVAFPFANIGNDLASYRLRISDVPDDWIVQFNGTTDVVDNLSADVADFPATGSAHQTIIELLIETDPFVPANSIVPLTITIEERDTGAYIGEHILPVRVGELRNGTLFPCHPAYLGRSNGLRRVQDPQGPQHRKRSNHLLRLD